MDDRIKRICGVSVAHLDRGRDIAFVRFQEAAQGVLALQVLPFRLPDIIEANGDNGGNTYALPDEALADVAKARNA